MKRLMHAILDRLGVPIHEDGWRLTVRGRILYALGVRYDEDKARTESQNRLL